MTRVKTWRLLVPLVTVVVLGAVALCVGLFTKAIDHLASEDESVRHGGVYALERVSELDPSYRGQTHALLTAFVRRHAPWPPVDGERPRRRHDAADDIGAVIAVLGRGSVLGSAAWSELERVDLRGADLAGLHIPRLCLAHSNLEGADLRGADLTGATLADANFRHTDLRGANLTDADLAGADFAGARTDDTTVWPAGFRPPD